MSYYNGNRTSYRPNRTASCPCNEASANTSSDNTICQNTSCNINATMPQNTFPSCHSPACTTNTIQEGLAIAYVPWQRFEELFCEDKAFKLGTAFPSLFKPFLAGGKC